MGREKIQVLKSVALIVIIYEGFWIFWGVLLWDRGDTGVAALIEDIANVGVVFLLVRSTQQMYPMTLQEMAIPSRLSLKNASLGLLLGIGFWLGASAISDMLRLILPAWASVPEEYNFSAQFAQSHGTERAILFFVFGITTPVIEEIFSRGLIYSVLKQAFSTPWTIVLSSALFGLGHIYLEAVIITFFIGCGLAWNRERRKSLLEPIMAHITINSLTLMSVDFNA